MKDSPHLLTLFLIYWLNKSLWVKLDPFLKLRYKYLDNKLFLTDLLFCYLILIQICAPALSELWFC